MDRLVELRDLLGPRGFYLLLEKAGGVLPLHGPVLAKWNPEKWKTIKAASDWVRRNRTWLTEKAISEARPKLIKYQFTGPRSSKLIAVSGLPDLKKAAEILAEFYPDQELKSVLWLE